MWFGLDIIVIYYFCNTRVVTLQQILQCCCYVEWKCVPNCNGSVLKCSLSAHWMQVKLFLSLLIWIVDCTQFLSEDHLNGCQNKPSEWKSNFWMVQIFKPNSNRFSVFRTSLVNISRSYARKTEGFLKTMYT